MDRESASQSKQAAAIQVSDDLYMVAMGVDEEGCEMFNPFSNTRLTAKAIHYRQADGGFSIGRDPAICRVEMISIGSDVAGCEMYQARPVNRNLDTLDITYARNTDGRYVVYRAKPDCGG